MNSERELFEDWAKSVTGLNLDKDENGLYISITTFMSFEAWCVSIERQGYKLVPVEPTGKMIRAVVEEVKKTGHLVCFYKAMIGAVDD